MVSVLLLSSNRAGLPTMTCWNPGRVWLVVLERAFFYYIFREVVRCTV